MNLEFKITKKQIFEIFDHQYLTIKENADQVNIHAKTLENGRRAVQLTVVLKKKDRDETPKEVELQNGDIFTTKF